MSLSNQDIEKIAERTASELDAIQERKMHYGEYSPEREDKTALTYQLKKKGIRQPFATSFAIIIRIGIYLIFFIIIVAILYFTQKLVGLI